MNNTNENISEKTQLKILESMGITREEYESQQKRRTYSSQVASIKKNTVNTIGIRDRNKENKEVKKIAHSIEEFKKNIDLILLSKKLSRKEIEKLEEELYIELGDLLRKIDNTYKEDSEANEMQIQKEHLNELFNIIKDRFPRLFSLLLTNTTYAKEFHLNILYKIFNDCPSAMHVSKGQKQRLQAVLLNIAEELGLNEYSDETRNKLISIIETKGYSDIRKLHKDKSEEQHLKYPSREVNKHYLLNMIQEPSVNIDLDIIEEETEEEPDVVITEVEPIVIDEEIDDIDEELKSMFEMTSEID